MISTFFKSNIAIAFYASLAAHLFFMTAVRVVAPDDLFESEPFTRVTFLGSILEKTAFDIMIEEKSGGGSSPGVFQSKGAGGGDLNVPPPVMDTVSPRMPFYSKSDMFSMARYTLPSEKAPPSGISGSGSPAPPGVFLGRLFPRTSGGRGVLSRPSPPVILRGLYGDREFFSVSVKGHVDSRGSVTGAEVARTSGYSFVDMEALKYFRQWKFDPAKEPHAGDEPIEAEITVYTVTGGIDDKP